MMKYLLVTAGALSLASVLFLTNAAYAAPCDDDIAVIDLALSEAEVTGDIDAETRARAAQLRSEGAALCKAGHHEQAAEKLAMAKELLGIPQ